MLGGFHKSEQHKVNLCILSGKYKGTKLASPNLSTTHPMGSREKLALFNMLAPYLEGARVLDYFAGSGALGLEALSRGATEVVFIENNPKARQTIKENAKKIGAQADFEVDGQFAIIISDPPYDNYQVPDYASLLEDGGILALSHPDDFDPETISGLTFLKTNKYAACNISLFTK